MAIKKINTDLQIEAGLLDGDGNSGVLNQVLVSTGTGVDWVDGSGSGIIGGPYLPLAGGTMSGAIQIPDATNIQFIGASGDHSRIVYTQGNGTTGDVWSHAFYQNSSYLAGIDFYSTTEALADGNIRFRTGGTSDRMTILTGGNVGIGTTSPDEKLVVATGASGWGVFHGASGWNGLALMGNSAGSGSALIFGNDYAATPTEEYRIWLDGATDKLIFTPGATYKGDPSAITPTMVMDSGGNVGIGTATPQSKLQVAGGIQMADDTDTASAAKIGTLKYRVSGNNSYVDMCMQTGASTYEWINIVQNNW